MNQMEKMAEIYEKKLGEEFKVKTDWGETKACKFTLEGVKYYEPVCATWYISESLTWKILTGRANIIQE